MRQFCGPGRGFVMHITNNYGQVGCTMKYFTLKYFLKNHGNFEIFQDPFFEIFYEIFNFHYKVT